MASSALNEAQTSFLALLMKNIKTRPDIDVRLPFPTRTSSPLVHPQC